MSVLSTYLPHLYHTERLMIIGVPSLVLWSLIIIENCSHTKKKLICPKCMYVLTRMARSRLLLKRLAIQRIQKGQKRGLFIYTYYQEIRPDRI